MMKSQGIREYFKKYGNEQQCEAYEDNEKKCRQKFIIVNTHVKNNQNRQSKLSTIKKLQAQYQSEPKTDKMKKMAGAIK